MLFSEGLGKVVKHMCSSDFSFAGKTSAWLQIVRIIMSMVKTFRLQAL